MVELSPLRAQADFNVGSARALSDLRKGRGEKLIPTRAVTDLVLALVTPQAAAELLGVSPFHELGENYFSGMQRPSRAGSWLKETAELRSNRPHSPGRPVPSKPTSSNSQLTPLLEFPYALLGKWQQRTVARGSSSTCKPCYGNGFQAAWR